MPFPADCIFEAVLSVTFACVIFDEREENLFLLISLSRKKTQLGEGEQNCKLGASLFEKVRLLDVGASC